MGLVGAFPLKLMRRHLQIQRNTKYPAITLRKLKQKFISVRDPGYSIVNTGLHKKYKFKLSEEAQLHCINNKDFITFTSHYEVGPLNAFILMWFHDHHVPETFLKET